MAEALDDEEIEEILDTYDELRVRTEVADELDYSIHTVRKYVDQAAEEGDPRAIDEDEEEAADEDGEWMGGGPTSSPFDQTITDDDVSDYAGMTPGDFLHDFFEDFEVGVKRAWVEIQARRADRRGVLPAKDSLKRDILNMKSGIAQSANQEAEYIAQEYWAEAQEFIRQAGKEFDPRMGQQQMMGAQPGFQGAQGMNGGGHSGFDQQGGGVGMGQQPNHQQQMVQMLLQEMREMRRELNESQRRDPTLDEKQSRLERLKELQEEKEILEDLSGDDEHVERLEQRITQLQQQIAQSNDGGQPAAPRQDASLEERLITLASQEPGVSLSDVMDIIDERRKVSTDPEVIKAEREADIREMELEHETQRYERLGDALEDGIASLGKGFAEGIISNGDDGDTSTDDETEDEDADTDLTTEAAAAPPPEPDPEQCPECDDVEMLHTEVGTFCPECEHGFAQCDLCQSPVEIPSRGNADYKGCPDCSHVIEAPEDPGAEVDCPECDWVGEAIKMQGEFLKCDGCGGFRPIERLPEGFDIESVMAGA